MLSASQRLPLPGGALAAPQPAPILAPSILAPSILAPSILAPSILAPSILALPPAA